MPALLAYPWAEDDLLEEKFAGDCSFYPSAEEALKVTGDEDFQTLLDLWIATVKPEDHFSLEDYAECVDEQRKTIAGFWVATPETFEVAEIAFGDPGNDTATYRGNVAMKRIIDKLAVKQVLRPS